MYLNLSCMIIFTYVLCAAPPIIQSSRLQHGVTVRDLACSERYAILQCFPHVKTDKQANPCGASASV